MYVDASYRKVISKLEISDTVTVIDISLDDLAIYNMIVGNKDQLRLPEQRNQAKDTYEYMGLTNSKVEIIKLALPLISTDYVAWIDAGISKLFQNPEEKFEWLAGVNFEINDGVIAAGITQGRPSLQQLCQEVVWRFCGGFLVCRTTQAGKFFNLSLSTLAKFLIEGYAVWEANVWADIIQSHPNFLQWYQAGWNDAMFNFPAECYTEEAP
jgi:hypothetical protein